MTGLYLFAAAAGVPLVAWFLLGGGDDGGDDGVGDQNGVGALMLRLLPLSSVAIAVAAFGVCGLALELSGTSAVVAFAGAVAVGVVAAVLNGTVFAYVRRSESGATPGDDELAGTVGRVVHPVTEGRRGRIAVSAGGQRRYLSAQALSQGSDRIELEVGAPVLVVEVRGGVASVTRLDPELTDDIHEPGAPYP
jgi:membrane protein implicated in regulation of membrane protease activity